MPKISIVLPTYNGEAFIRESIESIINQTEADWELIIVNDASTDRTLDICEEYSRIDSRIIILNNIKNMKLPASLNAGFERSKGIYLTWTSDDNLYKPDALRVMSEYLESNKETSLVACEYDIVDEDGDLLYKKNHIAGRDKPYSLLIGCYVGACFMYTRDVYKSIGGYDTNFFCAEDYEYWLRMALVGKISYIRENLYIYRMNKFSLTSTKESVVKEKTIELRDKYAPIMMSKFEIPGDELGAIYYAMWKYDTANKDLIFSAIKKNPLYAFRALMHLQKFAVRRLKKRIRRAWTGAMA